MTPRLGTASISERPGEATRADRSGATLFTGEQWQAINRALRLSPRESQIVEAIFDDETEAAIGMRLGISTHTVHSHLNRLYRKLDVNGRCPLLLRIFETHMSR